MSRSQPKFTGRQVLSWPTRWLTRSPRSTTRWSSSTWALVSAKWCSRWDIEQVGWEPDYLLPGFVRLSSEMWRCPWSRWRPWQSVSCVSALRKARFLQTRLSPWTCSSDAGWPGIIQKYSLVFYWTSVTSRYGKKYSEYKLYQGDFISPEFQSTISSSTFVLVNNFAFGPKVCLHQLSLVSSSFLCSGGWDTEGTICRSWGWDMDRVIEALLLAQLPDERPKLDQHWNDHACDCHGTLEGLRVLDWQANLILSPQGA